MSKRPYDTINTLFPVYRVTKFLGMFPFTINYTKKIYVIEKSKPWLVYSILIFTIPSVNNAIASFDMLYNESDQLVVRIITCYAFAFENLCRIMVFCTLCKRDTIMRLLRLLEDLDGYMGACGASVDHRREARIVKVLFYNLMLVPIQIQIGIILLDAMGSNRGTKFDIVVNFIKNGDTLNNLNFCAVTFHTISAVWLLGGRFRKVNDQLLSLQSEVGSRDQLERIKCLLLAHTKICDVARAIQSTLSVPMLIETTICFLTTIIFPYIAILQMFTDFFGKISKIIWNMVGVVVLNTCLHAIYNGASTVYTESGEAGRIIHRIFNKRHYDLWTLKLFGYSVQLVDRRVTLEACGMFKINKPLHFNMLGGIIIYLMIIFQFEIALMPVGSEEQRKNILFNKTIEGIVL